jgi:hypothetical protein
MNAKKIVESNDVESRLEKIFQPVHPSRKFVQKVRGRIYLAAPSVVVAQRLNNMPRFLLALGAVFSVSLLLISGARALFYLTRRSSDQ